MFTLSPRTLEGSPKPLGGSLSFRKNSSLLLYQDFDLAAGAGIESKGALPGLRGGSNTAPQAKAALLNPHPLFQAGEPWLR